MKFLPVVCTSILILAACICGCTSSSSTAAPATTAAPAAAAVTTAEPVTTATPSIAGTAWSLGWYFTTNGIWSKVAEGSNVTATFSTGGNSVDGTVSGSSGCSKYVTTYHLGKGQEIWVKRPEVPTLVCQSPFGVMNQEAAYNSDLELARNYSITNGQLLIFNDQGQKILQFDPS
jgi:heat shock protein HslJ